MFWTRVTRRVNLRSKGQVTGNENVKIVVCAYLCLQWVNCRSIRQPKTKMISGPFYVHISSNTFHQQICFVFVITCNW